MSVVLSELTIDTNLSTSNDKIITTTTNSTAFIGSAVFTNTGTITESVTVWRLGLDENGADTPETATNYLVKKDILPKKSYTCEELIGQVISFGSHIKATTENADTTDTGAVAVNISGTIAV